MPVAARHLFKEIIMKASEFRIRDPFILPYDGKYYLYASDFPKGFKAYVSSDLENWSDSVSVIEFPEGFWATKNFWAPEVHYYKGKFYLFASLYSDSHNRGTQIFEADNPLGPFEIISDGPQTPKEWMCLDGTLFIEDSKPYMIFCHEWLQTKDGEMCFVELSEDLRRTVGESHLMFKAGDFPFVKTVTEEEGNFVTDGPFLHRLKTGELVMMWSSYGEKGYFENVVRSSNGHLDGKWESMNFLCETDGGHGMLFEDFSGNLKLCLHQPNKDNERLTIFDIIEENGTIRIK